MQIQEFTMLSSPQRASSATRNEEPPTRCILSQRQKCPPTLYLQRLFPTEEDLKLPEFQYLLGLGVRIRNLESLVTNSTCSKGSSGVLPA